MRKHRIISCILFVCMLLGGSVAVWKTPLAQVESAVAEVTTLEKEFAPTTLVGGIGTINQKQIMFNLGAGAVELPTGTYVQSGGSVTLLRNGEVYTPSKGCNLNIAFDYATSQGDVSMTLGSAFTASLGVAYTRQAGDVITVEGRWVHTDNSYAVNLKKFTLTVGENDMQTVELVKTELDEDEIFRMVEGASIRLNEENGLRFMAEIGDEVTAGATYYMMIVPKAYLDKFSITGEYYTALKAALEEGGYNPFIATMQAVPFLFEPETVAASDGALKDGCYYIRGSLTSIQYNNMNTEFFGIAYSVDEEGKYTYAAFLEGTNVRTVVEVAQAAMADTSKEYAEWEQSILQDFIDAGEAQAAGKTEVEYEAEKAV